MRAAAHDGGEPSAIGVPRRATGSRPSSSASAAAIAGPCRQTRRVCRSRRRTARRRRRRRRCRAATSRQQAIWRQTAAVRPNVIGVAGCSSVRPSMMRRGVRVGELPQRRSQRALVIAEEEPRTAEEEHERGVGDVLARRAPVDVGGCRRDCGCGRDRRARRRAESMASPSAGSRAAAPGDRSRLRRPRPRRWLRRPPGESRRHAPRRAPAPTRRRAWRRSRCDRRRPPPAPGSCTARR